MAYMPKTIWQTKIAERNTTVSCATEPKQAATDVTHQTIPHASCAFHRKMRPEATLATPRCAATMATKMCWSSLPLAPKAGNKTSIAIPAATHTETTERTSDVA